MKNIIYKVEDIFHDIEGDSDNVNMTIPEEIMREKGWGEGTRIKVEIGDQGTIILSEIKDNDGQE
jgi:bifunctional DNA-binding transcriptional regulator/antitoxin component of YhaV-PrlF toxin-antitoxin module